MNEIRVANYTMFAIMLLTMVTFCITLNSINKPSSFISNTQTKILLGYQY